MSFWTTWKWSRWEGKSQKIGSKMEHLNTPKVPSYVGKVCQKYDFRNKFREPETCICYVFEHLVKWLTRRVEFSGWWNLCKKWMKEEPKDSSERFQRTRTLPDSYHSQKINLYSRLDENSTWNFRVASPNVNSHVERSLCRLHGGPFFYSRYISATFCWSSFRGRESFWQGLLRLLYLSGSGLLSKIRML